MNINIDSLLMYIEKTVKEHKLAPGKYARWKIQNAEGTLNLDSSEYGCADAANILYTIGKFPRDINERVACIKELQSFQKDNGTFEEPTHHPLHTTAHCVAALELFDASPAKPLTYHLTNFGTPQQVSEFLSGGDWSNDVWQAHKSAGFYSAMAICCDMPMEWHDAYFDWFAQHIDKTNGVNVEGAQNGQRNMLFHLASWFHNVFNHTYAHRPILNAEKCIDAMIDFFRNRENEDPYLGKRITFYEIDWLYLINRASMQTGHRRAEVLECIREFALFYIPFLEKDIESTYKIKFDDLHLLFGVVCALAELQIALPGEIKSTIPLKNVLDRRPFI
ncbi:MAG: hypothetical protein IJ460_00810 [Clostridia bacterium]|nr:hypothetical protein [Clostridia bacterium]